MANKRLNIFIFEQAYILSVQHFAHTHSHQSKLAKTATTFTFSPTKLSQIHAIQIVDDRPCTKTFLLMN